MRGEVRVQQLLAKERVLSRVTTGTMDGNGLCSFTSRNFRKIYAEGSIKQVARGEKK